ncbi:MAG: DEAD/DEAH box helicase [Pseudomonadota bacterium]
MTADTPSSVEGDTLRFSDLGLPQAILDVLTSVGYETPSPIQAETIPHLLAGRDVLGQAQTGTGKTAAFALPLLAKINVHEKKPQALILAPTRELAIQVAEALQKYASKLPGFHVLPIYGGQAYGPQLAALRRGVHVVVGTPGRVIDHLEKGSLKLDEIKHLVLDEADEMLRMGFIDDVENILKTTPATKQVALFSATMPPQIKRIANTYLKDPVEVAIASKTRTATTVRQRCIVLMPGAKLDALTRLLEVETFEGMLIFTRTKVATEELAEKLSARGYSVAALNGDIAQQQRERTVAKLKDGQLDIVVATDVAARGLDVERISHVINYDVPNDAESYVHRIGRTGRAGREGDAILFIAPRERGLLKMIEKTTRKHIEIMSVPSDAAIKATRVAKFQQKVVETLATDKKLDPMRALVAQLEAELGRDKEVSLLDIAAALAQMAQGGKVLAGSSGSDAAQTVREHSSDRPARAAPTYERHSRSSERPAERGNSFSDRSSSYSSDKPARFAKPSFRDSAPAYTSTAAPVESDKPRFRAPSEDSSPRTPFERPERPSFNKPDRAERPTFTKPERAERPSFESREEKPKRAKSDEGMETFRIEVGHQHGVLPKNIVGAIANEADLDSQYIGRIDIRDDHSLIDLPEGMPKEVFSQLQKVWVAGQRLQISKHGAGDSTPKSTYVKKPFKAKPRAEADE